MLKYTQDLTREPSPMELKIAQRLKDANIQFAIEVMFAGCVNPLTGQKLKYDFYCYNHNMLIEYDGRLFHIRDEVKARDKIKNEFARKMRIKLIRLKTRADVVDFFNSDPFNPKRSEPRKEPKAPKKKEINLNFNPNTYDERKKSKEVISVLELEIRRLEALKSTSHAKYKKRVEYIFNNNRKLFDSVIAYYRLHKKAA